MWRGRTVKHDKSKYDWTGGAESNLSGRVTRQFYTLELSSPKSATKTERPTVRMGVHYDGSTLRLGLYVHNLVVPVKNKEADMSQLTQLPNVKTGMLETTLVDGTFSLEVKVGGSFRDMFGADFYQGEFKWGLLQIPGLPSGLALSFQYISVQAFRESVQNFSRLTPEQFKAFFEYSNLPQAQRDGVRELIT